MWLEIWVNILGTEKGRREKNWLDDLPTKNRDSSTGWILSYKQNYLFLTSLSIPTVPTVEAINDGLFISSGLDLTWECLLGQRVCLGSMYLQGATMERER